MTFRIRSRVRSLKVEFILQEAAIVFQVRLSVLKRKTSMVVHIATNPLHAVIDAARQMVVTRLSTELWQTHGNK